MRSTVAFKAKAKGRERNNLMGKNNREIRDRYLRI